MADWDRDVLDFWFDELTQEDWFTSRPETDETIRRRFLKLWQELREAVPAAALLEAEPALAATLVLDQFPRNMFRRQPDAFATDRLAQAVAHNALRCGFPEALPPSRRTFLYMPFMHAEALAEQELCVRLFDGTPNARYAVEHRDIIARFGRFPHRNATLGRASTEAETAFLAGHAGFGQ